MCMRVRLSGCRACRHMFPWTGLCLARHYVERSGTAPREPAAEAGGHDQRPKVGDKLGEFTGKLTAQEGKHGMCSTSSDVPSSQKKIILRSLLCDRRVTLCR